MVDFTSWGAGQASWTRSTQGTSSLQPLSPSLPLMMSTLRGSFLSGLLLVRRAWVGVKDSSSALALANASIKGANASRIIENVTLDVITEGHVIMSSRNNSHVMLSHM